MLVRGVRLAVFLNLSRSRITQMRNEGKIQYAYGEPLRLYNLNDAVNDYYHNSNLNHVHAHQADKLDGVRYIRY